MLSKAIYSSIPIPNIILYKLCIVCIVTLLSERKCFQMRSNRYQIVSVWTQSIYVKESNRASQKRPPSSRNQIICFLRAISLPSLGNVFLYCGGQVVDFSALWVKIWALRFPAWLNDFLHWAQEWGFSPVCVSMCFLRVPASPKDLLHAAHLCGFSPVWITKCLFKS